MAKGELVDRLKAQFPELRVGQIGEVVDATFDAVKELAKEGPVKIRHFGTFTVKVKAARIGRSPKDNSPIMIPEHTVFRFKATKPKKEKEEA